MKIAVDLHIHSSLSPCADNSMSPNNVINMAKLKGLDAIAITDHNSLKNIPAFMKVAHKNNMICIPGVEITTREEVHLLGLFRDIQSAYTFQKVIDHILPKEKNDVNLFGNQYIYNEKDEIIEEYELLLTNALRLSLEEAIDEIRKLNGIPIPAHVNRKRFSILSNLGFISPHLNIKAIEISPQSDCKIIEELSPKFQEYKKIRSSDAHILGLILEREFFLEVEECSIEGILKALDC